VQRKVFRRKRGFLLFLIGVDGIMLTFLLVACYMELLTGCTVDTGRLGSGCFRHQVKGEEKSLTTELGPLENVSLKH
jgi:hypothetical protein